MRSDFSLNKNKPSEHPHLQALYHPEGFTFEVQRFQRVKCKSGCCLSRTRNTELLRTLYTNSCVFVERRSVLFCPCEGEGGGVG